MKKIKLLTPIVALTGLSAAVVPMVTLSSCNKNQANKVYLATGEAAEKTVSATTEKVVFRFKQDNLVSPEYTKVSVANFAINGVEHHVWAKTMMYRTDSAGNITVYVNTATIRSGMANDVSTISFNLVFKNAKAGTHYKVGTFTIKLDESEATEVDTSALEAKGLNVKITPMKESFDYLAPFKLTIELAANEVLQDIIMTKASSNDKLNIGEDYAFYKKGSSEENPNAQEYVVVPLVSANEAKKFVIEGIAKGEYADPQLSIRNYDDEPAGENDILNAVATEEDGGKEEEEDIVSETNSDSTYETILGVEFDYNNFQWGITKCWNIDPNNTGGVNLSISNYYNDYLWFKGFPKATGTYIVTIGLYYDDSSNARDPDYLYSFVLHTEAKKSKEEAETGEEIKEMDEKDDEDAQILTPINFVEL